MNSPASDITAFMCTGVFAACIKYIDDARDEHYYGGRYILPALVVANLAATSAMMLSTPMQLLLGAIVIGCYFGGKLDNMEFKVTGVLVICMVFALRLQAGRLDLYLFSMCSTLALVDEVLNRASDVRPTGVLKAMLKNKPALPVGLAALAVLYPETWRLLVGVAVFDTAYALVGASHNSISRLDPHAPPQPLSTIPQGAVIKEIDHGSESSFPTFS